MAVKTNKTVYELPDESQSSRDECSLVPSLALLYSAFYLDKSKRLIKDASIRDVTTN